MRQVVDVGDAVLEARRGIALAKCDQHGGDHQDAKPQRLQLPAELADDGLRSTLVWNGMARSTLATCRRRRLRRCSNGQWAPPKASRVVREHPRASQEGSGHERWTMCAAWPSRAGAGSTDFWPTPAAGDKDIDLRCHLKDRGGVPQLRPAAHHRRVGAAAVGRWGRIGCTA